MDSPIARVTLPLGFSNGLLAKILTILENSVVVSENELGVIAESYDMLQGLHILKAARAKCSLEKASPESTVQAILQATEIALLNLTDLMKRAADDVCCGAFHSAMVKVSWALGFHTVLTRISLMPHQLAISCNLGDSETSLHICESPAFKQYVDTIKKFDNNVIEQIEIKSIEISNLLASETLDNVLLKFLHTVRICNHEATIWERNLASINIPKEVVSYKAFVVADDPHDAVYSNTLSGDTFYTQFRGLHQIPEILGEEINDHLEQAIREIRLNRLQQAIERLHWTNLMFEGILVTLPPMVTNLTTSDYHSIRDNLGLTSGSHSVCLRHHLFKDLYEQLWVAVISLMNAYVVLKGKDEQGTDKQVVSVEELICQVDRTRFQDFYVWKIHLLLNECLNLRLFINQWRELHLHLPRNELGSSSVKSLTGSLDAIARTKQMQSQARKNDPMEPLATARKLENSSGDTPLAQYLGLDTSLDNQILKATGAITRHRFKDVQERTGFFAQQCPFAPPPPRNI